MVGIGLAVLGLALMIASLFLPPAQLFSEPWAIEPLSYIGIGSVVFGLATAVSVYVVSSMRHRHANGLNGADDWSKLTEQHFETFQHDLGRPMGFMIHWDPLDLSWSLTSAAAGLSGKLPNKTG